MNDQIIIHKSDSPHKRHIKKRFRNKLKRGKNNKRSIVPANIMGTRRHHFSYISEIEIFCEKNNISRWQKINRNIYLNSSCSLHEDPNNVFKPLLYLLHYAKYGDQKLLPKLVCKNSISFGALYLLDNICWEISNHRRWGIEFKNICPSDHEILSELKTFHSYSSNNSNSRTINEKVAINRDDPFSQSYKVKAKEITDMVGQAIGESRSIPNYELPFKASQAINSTIGEHFDNIKQHAPEAKSGILCGFYNKIDKVVDILIFNFGQTIAETLTINSLPSQIQEIIDDVIGNYTTQNLFSNENNFTKENALTLLALQEGISSKLNDNDLSRGHGLIDYIEHCFELSIGTKIVIISGKTAIKINNNYVIEQKQIFNRKRRILAFNLDNDIYKIPDPSHVMNLNYFFPGVIIETTIPLN